MAGYIHDIDPVIASIGGVCLWWYGLSYTLGFLNLHQFVRRRRDALNFSLSQVYDLTLLVAAGVLLGGRMVEVIFYEWPFYQRHLLLIPAYWIGGMATHGLLLGGLAGTALFCWRRGISLLTVLDALAVPAAFIMGVGRIGNFIDGQIVGSLTEVPWGVKFPDAEGFRHPVVLYDGLKNLLIIPVLLWASRRSAGPGAVTGLFLFLYAFLRIFVDVFREYPTSLLGLATGQVLNIAMSLGGLALLLLAGKTAQAAAPPAERPNAPLAWRRALLAALLLFSLVLPSDWTQDVSARYGKRHPGLRESLLYPRIEERGAQ